MSIKHRASLGVSIYAALIVSGCTFSIENNVPSENYTVEDLSSDEFYEVLSREGVSSDDLVDNPLEMTEDSAFVHEGNVLLLLHGSSSCPPTPTVSETSTDEDNELITEVVLGHNIHGDVPCTDDYGQHFYLLDFTKSEVADEVSIVISDSKTLPLLIPAQ